MDTEDNPFGAGCKRVLQVMLERGSSIGLQATCYGNYCGSLSLKGEERISPEKVIGIWSHLDVVPAGEGWHYHPYNAVYEEGLVIGRGAQDNKSAAVMGLYLLKGLKELSIRLEHPVALYMGCSEECGMQDLDYFLANYKAPGFSLIADCGFPACYGEKGNIVLRIYSGKKSVLRDVEVEAGIMHNVIPGAARIKLTTSDGKTFKMAAEGLSGHSAFPEGSVNAIAILIEKIMNEQGIPAEEKNVLIPFAAFTASNDGRAAGINVKDTVFGNLTCCGTVLTFENEKWNLDLDIRYPHSVDPEWILQKVRGAAEAQGCMVEFKSHLPSFGFSPDHPLVQKLTEIYNRESGCEAKPYTMADGTYAAKLPNAIPFGISFPDKSAIIQKFPKGYGDYHQPDEAVIADQILEALYLYLISVSELDELLT